MTLHHKKSACIYLVFQILAVAIICVGSLINFHQYKIWGKPLLPQFVGYKREIEKSVKVISGSRFNLDDDLVQKHLSSIHGICPIEVNHIYCVSCSFISLNLSFEIPGSIRPYSSGL
ncbi:MAG: hypothetical protein WCI71_15975, partial [Bacteroidota bacterium]